MPAVAVVMPAFDAEAYIAEAIESVLAQSAADWQLAVADDGSADGTVAVARSFDDPRIAVLELEHRGLPAAARNAGIGATEAPLVAFLDADDVWYPPKLERQLAVLAARPEVGVVYALADALRAGRREPVRSDAPEGDVLERLAQGNPIHNSSVVVRRELLERVGALDEDPELRGTEDYELWLRLAGATTFACVHEPLLAYRVRPGGLGADPERMRRGAIVALRKARARDPRRFERLGPDFARSHAILDFLAGGGRAGLVGALRRRPGDLRAWKWLLLSLLGRRPAAWLTEIRWRRALR